MSTVLDGCTPWPEDVAAEYRAAGYWRGEELGTLLSEWSLANGERTALVHRDRRVSYAELDHWAHRLAAGFAASGIGQGDRVLVQLPNIPEFVAVYFGLIRAGAHPVFALPGHRATEVGHLVEASGAIGYVVSTAHVGLAAQIQRSFPLLRHVFVAGEAGDFTPLSEVERDPVALPERDPSDVAFFLLSGGTTALPKLVPRTHDDYAYQIRAGAEVCSVTADDVYLAVLPVEFNLSLGCPGVLGTLHSGGTVVLAEDSTAAACFELIEREKVTFTALVPTIVRLWIEEVQWTSRDLSSLRFVLVGGAPLPPELARRIGPALGCVLTQSFGMAEGFLLYSAESDDEVTRSTTQGRPMSPHDELRIVDDEDNDVTPGEAGHLLVRGPYTIRGYFRTPEHNRKAFTADGFYRTGDIVRMAECGSLVVEGRAKDVIIRGGDKISPSEIEGYLLEHRSVHQVAVVAMPDELLGERTCAFVTTVGEPPSALELKRMLHARGVADYKLPDRVEFVDALPLTPLGKVDRVSLRAQLAEQSRV